MLDPSSALSRRARALSWFTILYNLAEGVVSVSFGVSEGSIALAGFGVDSFIEVASAILVLWRLQAHSTIARSREVIATSGIGWLFLVLAAATGLGGAWQLRSGSHPETTLPGVVISALSLSFMFSLWRAKLRVAEETGSAAIAKDAACSLACIQLSAILFVGSLAFAVNPNLWWADSVAALLLSFFIGREGFETLRAVRRPDFSGGCGCGA